MGNTYPDGCAGAALDGSFQVPTAFVHGGFFNATAATLADYTASRCTNARNAPCRAPWNVAGVDYPISYETSTVFVDPATLSIPGCTYAIQPWGGGTFTCGGKLFSATEIDNLELGAIGGHQCTALVIAGVIGRVAPLLIKNFHFKNTDALCHASKGIHSAIWINNASYNVNLSQFEMDGNSNTFTSAFDPNNSQNDVTNPVNAIIVTNTNVTVQYAYIHDFASDTFLPGFGPNAYARMQFSFIKGWCLRSPTCHAEYWSGGGGNTISVKGTRGEISTYNVILRDWYESDFGPAAHWFASTWNNPQPIDLLEFSNNTQINSYIGKLRAKGSIYACAGGKPIGGTPRRPSCDKSSPDGILYMTQGAIGTGISFMCGGHAISAWQEIPGPYPITQPRITDEFQMDNPSAPITSANYYPNYKLPGIQCLNVTVSPDMVGDAAVISGHGGNPIKQAIIHDNYIDASSQKRNPDLYLFDNDRAVSFTGTIATIDGVTTLTSTTSQSIQVGETIDAPGVGNCSNNILDCPTVTKGGTGTSFMISPTVSDVATPRDMIHIRLSVCSTPVDLSGNVSSAPGAFTDAWMNTISPAQPRSSHGIGCQ